MTILIKKAVDRKKDYIYWLDRKGNLMMDSISMKGIRKVYVKDLIEARDYFIEHSVNRSCKN